MLAHLRVRNVGVLEDAAIEPGPGFTVITGETGAGKTLLLGSLRLLTGDRGSGGTVGPFAAEAMVEGLFEVEGEELAVTRVIPREGRNRAYLEGALVSAATLTERVGALVEIVGQHDQLALRRPAAMLALVDGALDTAGREVLAAYREGWERYRTALDDQQRLGGDTIALERELDLVRYQAEEIERAGLRNGDDRRLESMAARLRHAEQIRDHLAAGTGDLETVNEALGMAVARLRRVVELDPGSAEALQTAEGLSSLAQDLAITVRDLAESVVADPEELAILEERLTEIGGLKRKYGRTLDEVLAYGEEVRRRAGELESLLASAATIDAEVARLGGEVATLAATLHRARVAAGERVGATAAGHLADLGLAAAAIEVIVTETDPAPGGGDRVELRFASDRRLDTGKVTEIASGGELSRLVLALRLATASRDADTLIFDEVDAGVGGATALALGRKLADLATSAQVLCVTHLPQVGAYADTHYVVEREGTSTRVRRVEGEERLSELSRMLAGLPDSEPGREAAAELLHGARSG